MKTYKTEEVFFEIDPMEDITAYELASIMTKGFNPHGFFVKDTASYAHSVKLAIAKLPKELIRHFVRNTYDVIYKKHLLAPDVPITQNLIKSERLTNLTTI